MKRKREDSKDYKLLHQLQLVFGISNKMLKYLENLSDDYLFPNEKARQDFYANIPKKKPREINEQNECTNNEKIKVTLDKTPLKNYFDNPQSSLQKFKETSK